MKLHQLIAIGALAAFGAGAASAQGVPPPGGQMPGAGTDEFSKLDKDGDGVISKKEAGKNKDLAKRFSELDGNQDGKLDQGEFARFEVSPGGATDQPADKPKY